jgi:hypothetical protein
VAEEAWRQDGWTPPSPFLWVDWLLVGADPAGWNETKRWRRREPARQTDMLASYLTDDPASYQFPRRREFLGDQGQVENPDARVYLGSVLRTLWPGSADEAIAAIPDALARRRWFQGWHLGTNKPGTPAAHAALREHDRILAATGDADLAEQVRAAFFDGCRKSQVTGAPGRVAVILWTDREKEAWRVLDARKLPPARAVRNVPLQSVRDLHDTADTVAVVTAGLQEASPGQAQGAVVNAEEEARDLAHRVDWVQRNFQGLHDEPASDAFMADPLLIAEGHPRTYIRLATMNALARALVGSRDAPDVAIARFNVLEQRLDDGWNVLRGRETPRLPDHGIEGR